MSLDLIPVLEWLFMTICLEQSGGGRTEQVPELGFGEILGYLV